MVHERNDLARRITKVIGRPAQIGHIGEFIASKIFDIELERSAVAKGIDGAFRTGPLHGKTVNVKFYGKREGTLDIREDSIPDYFLVFSGPRPTNMTSVNEIRPWHIDWVFLFHAASLLAQLRERSVKIGVATSVYSTLWDLAEIHPKATNTIFSLSEGQRKLLQLFSS